MVKLPSDSLKKEEKKKKDKHGLHRRNPSTFTVCLTKSIAKAAGFLQRPCHEQDNKPIDWGCLSEIRPARDWIPNYPLATKFGLIFTKFLQLDFVVLHPPSTWKSASESEREKLWIWERERERERERESAPLCVCVSECRVWEWKRTMNVREWREVGKKWKSGRVLIKLK